MLHPQGGLVSITSTPTEIKLQGFLLNIWITIIKI